MLLMLDDSNLFYLSVSCTFLLNPIHVFRFTFMFVKKKQIARVVGAVALNLKYIYIDSYLISFWIYFFRKKIDE